MSQQSTKGTIDTWCDEVGCDSHAPAAKVKGKAQHSNYTLNLQELGWTIRLRKDSEKKFVTNKYRHRCPNCSRPDKQGRIK